MSLAAYKHTPTQAGRGEVIPRRKYLQGRLPNAKFKALEPPWRSGLSSRERGFGALINKERGQLVYIYSEPAEQQAGNRCPYVTRQSLTVNTAIYHEDI